MSELTIAASTIVLIASRAAPLSSKAAVISMRQFLYASGFVNRFGHLSAMFRSSSRIFVLFSKAGRRAVVTSPGDTLHEASCLASYIFMDRRRDRTHRRRTPSRNPRITSNLWLLRSPPAVEVVNQAVQAVVNRSHHPRPLLVKNNALPQQSANVESPVQPTSRANPFAAASFMSPS